MYRKTTLAIIALVSLCMLMISIPEISANPKFIISSWAFPADEYGQGIEALAIYENSTGSWLVVGGFAPNLDHSEAGVFNWTAGVGIKFRTYCWLNSTLVNVTSTTQGKNYLRHDVTVTDKDEAIVFEKQNFTYFAAGAVGAMYEYDYDVILDFLPESTQTYYVTIGYDIFYSPFGVEYNSTLHIADSGTGDFADSRVKDGVNYWTTDALVSTNPEYAYFIIDSEETVLSFNYRFYGAGDHSWLKYYNGVSLVDLDYINNPANQWHNGTVNLAGNNITLAIHSNASEYYLDCDYLAITYSYTVLSWHELTDVHVIFDLFTEPALNYVDMWLVFAGLLLIPASTVYLAKGGRDELTSDKLFYGLIAFIMGWALVIGGIMP